MSPRLFGLIVVTAFAASGSIAAQQFVQLPPGSWASDVSDDGQVVVGWDSQGNGLIWRWRVDPEPTIVPGGYFTAVADDGLVACGNTTHPGSGEDVAGIWTAATGWQSLGWLPGAITSGCGGGPSSAYDISRDGTTVVGLSYEGCDGRGFIWTAATGMEELFKLEQGHNRCSAVSGDGLVLAGFAQGTFSRTPAYWSWDTTGFVIDADLQGEVSNLNTQGDLSVGRLFFSGNWQTAFVRDSTGAMTNLGSLQSGWGSTASDLSEDGAVIVGYDLLQLARKAWVWRDTDGMIGLQQRLSAQGLLGIPPLLTCKSTSVDGTVFVGEGEIGGGQLGTCGYIAELPSTSQPWVNLLGGLAGTSGIPKLVGTGSLVPHTPAKLALTQGKPLAPATLAVGLSPALVPFKQGVLVPFPNYLLGMPPLSGAGSVTLNFSWPGGMPSGAKLWWQFIIKDSEAPAGFALSNALRSQTP